jgi:hypothetical protein
MGNGGATDQVLCVFVLHKCCVRRPLKTRAPTAPNLRPWLHRRPRPDHRGACASCVMWLAAPAQCQ